MKRLLRVVLFGLLSLIVLVALGLGGWQLYRVLTRPTLDAAGGTILIYELDLDAYPDRQLPDTYHAADMAETLQRRLDPGNWLGITVQPLNDARFEVSIPRAGDHTAGVQQAKELIAQTGMLAFRILANLQDDQAGIAAVRSYLEAARDAGVPEDKRAERQGELERSAARGLPPPAPRGADASGRFRWSNAWGSGEASYSWVEVGRAERYSLQLHNAVRDDPQRNQRWQAAAKAREERKTVVLHDFGETVLFSRRCSNARLPAEEQARKEFDYFILTRDPNAGEDVTGRYLVRADSAVDQNQQPVLSFRFGQQGGDLFFTLTSQNKPTGNPDGRFYRQLAIILDDQIVSAPRLNEAIRSDGQISGNFTAREVEQLATILQAGALPARLKPWPVSEIIVAPK